MENTEPQVVSLRLRGERRKRVDALLERFRAEDPNAGWTFSGVLRELVDRGLDVYEDPPE